MEAGAAGARHAAESILSGAASLIKGIRHQAHPAHPLTAHLTHVTSAPLPRVHHTLSVVKGRAYIFGGKTSTDELAENDMHIVILPSSGVLDADYTTVKARPEESGGEVPKGREGHSSVVIGDSIYIFGGEGVEEEKGRVWAFHTVRNTWTYLDAAPDTVYPRHRTLHASASSEFPGPKDITYQEKAPQKPADPANVVPEPANADSWGTIFVVGGKNPQTGELITDALAFDIRTRTWSNIPTPPGPPLGGSSLTLLGTNLYRFGGKAGGYGSTANGTLQFLDVSPVWKHAEGGTTPLSSGWAWEDIAIAPAASDPSNATTPQPRFNAGLTGVTTGQGRNYLVLLSGSSPAPSETTTLLDDIWAFQLPPSFGSAAATKDALRSSLKQDTYGGHWLELGYRYIDAQGEVIDHGENNEEKGFGARTGFAVAKGTEVDGASVVVWGGVDAGGRVLGDGWLITVER